MKFQQSNSLLQYISSIFCISLKPSQLFHSSNTYIAPPMFTLYLLGTAFANVYRTSCLTHIMFVFIYWTAPWPVTSLFLFTFTFKCKTDAVSGRCHLERFAKPAYYSWLRQHQHFQLTIRLTALLVLPAGIGFKKISKKYIWLSFVCNAVSVKYFPLACLTKQM